MTPVPILAFLFHLAGGLVVVTVYRAWQRKQGFSTEGMRIVFLAALAGGLLGAGLLQYFTGAGGSEFWRRTLGEHLMHLLLGGRTWLGALLGGYLAVEITKRTLGIRRSTGDGFALALPLGEAVGRIGCFFGGCCYGSVCALPWAVWQHDAWRHPAQLYSAGAALVLFAVLWQLRHRVEREGDLFKLYLFLYAGARFGLEFLRDHGPGAAQMSAAQWLCLASMAVLAIYWLARGAPLPAGRGPGERPGEARPAGGQETGGWNPRGQRVVES
jgi:phosphatidylglycerol:prolipoprotein diacylglycerol transferase